MDQIKKWFHNTSRRIRIAAGRTYTGIRRKTREAARSLRTKLSAPRTRRPKGAGGAHVSIFTERVKKPNFILSVIITTTRMFALLILILAVGGAGALLGVAKAYVESTPNLDIERIEDQATNSYIYDRNGKLITEYRGTENRVWATLDEIPEQLQNAFIAIEDMRFYQHNGIDIKRIGGAFLSNMTSSGGTEGGSTITQQIIKLRLLSNERSYKRKLQEAYLAMQLEQEYSKEEILETYLNTIHLGESNYGVKAAALDYFEKPLNQLTLRECAMLAGLTQNPYSYNPRKNYYDPSRSPERTDKRTNTVLERMLKSGFITKAQYDAAVAEQLAIIEQPSRPTLYDYPHFVEYVISDVVTTMLRQRNLYDTDQNRRLMEQEIRTQGWHIYTTIDPDVQQVLEDSIYGWDKYPKLLRSSDAVINRTLADGSTETTVQPQASAVIEDWRTGEIRAMVGSRTPPKQMKTLNRASKAAMPIGSSIKPIAVYGPALDKGASPASIYYNIPAQIEGWVSETGFPRNYGGGGYTGPTTMRQGVIKSLNIVSARTLLETVGLTDSKNYLINLGVNKDKIGGTPSDLALGTAGVSTLDLTSAYATIANKGLYQQPISFTVVKDSNGGVVVDARTGRASRQVFKPSTSWMLIDILTQAVQSGTGGRAQISGMPVAGKTGTNSEYRGVTFAGVTPYYASAIWIGHDLNQPLVDGAQGGQYAAPLWKDYMAKIHEGLDKLPIIEDKPEDLGLVRKTVCSVSGKLATTACGENTVTDWFLKGTAPTEPCDMHVGEIEICTDSNLPVGEFCPEQTRQKSSGVFIPEGHILRSAPLEVIQQYIPGATFTPPGMAPLVPNEQPQTCTLHTKQWHDTVIQAQQLIASARNLIGLYEPLLTPTQVAQIGAQITSLETVLADTKTPAETIAEAMAPLKATVDALLSSPPEPEPEPDFPFPTLPPFDSWPQG